MRRILSFLTYVASATSFLLPSMVKTPPIVPIKWDTLKSSYKSFCIEDNTKLQLKNNLISILIKNTIDNINLQTASVPRRALFFYIDDICRKDSSYIKLTNDTSNDISVAFCTRDFDFKSNPPLYNGCNITLNMCVLKNAATFYNVLLHEFLHVVGLDHPDPPEKDAIISHGVTMIEYNSTRYRRQDKYKILSHYDKLGIQKILKRDFYTSYYPYSNYNIYPYINPLLSLVEKDSNSHFTSKIIDSNNC